MSASRIKIGLGSGLQNANGNQLIVHQKPSNIKSIEIEESKCLAEIAELNTLSIRFQKFKKLVFEPNVNFEELRKLSWPGIPEELRPIVWKLLLGYLPANSDRREATLLRKRAEYKEFVQQCKPNDAAMVRQIHIDIQRTNAHIPLYQNDSTKESLERVLYIWSTRHPASGYVQGINDLMTPFFQVFLTEHTTSPIATFAFDTLPKETIEIIEADTYWCLSKLLDGIQDSYTHGQPGIVRQVKRLKELVTRVDPPLSKHLEKEGIEFIQFSFRWMNCLLMRELSTDNIVRMWDSYLSDGPDGFSEFHLYVCAAFLIKWSAQLQKMDFGEIMMMVQSLPTQNWGSKEIEILLSEAFMWKSLFHNSQAHLST